ncbi:hypothetical protein ACNF36_02890 [Mycoplasma sp. 4463]|uniref:hypothetical protein n=1 Tax=Mycoplasma sp. 4463 TaxID=3400998 RepID=UPI003AAF13C8
MDPIFWVLIAVGIIFYIIFISLIVWRRIYRKKALKKKIILKVKDNLLKQKSNIEMSRTKKSRQASKYKKMYFDLCDRIIKEYNTKILPFRHQNIKLYKLSNYQENEQWFFHRHHIDEIHISGAELKTDKEAYRNGLSIVVSYEQHALLHYLIVLNNETYPNHGMLMMMELKEWDEIVQKRCKKWDIPYVPEWKQNLSIFNNPPHTTALFEEIVKNVTKGNEFKDNNF